ncbi:MAG: ABC transporter ATP-binding protein [Microlunatus sp.]
MPEVRRLSPTPDERRVLRRAMPWFRGHRIAWLLATVVSLAAAVAQVGGFALLGVLTDAVLAGDRRRALAAVAGFAGLALTLWLLSWLSQYLVVRVGERVVRGLREQALERIAAAPLRFLENHRSGDLLRRLTGEIAALSQFVGVTLSGLVNGALLLVVTAVTVTLYSWLLALCLALLAAGSTMVLGRAFTRRASTTYALLAAAEADVSATFSETIPARDQLMVLGARRRRIRRFAADNQRLLDARIREVRTDRWLTGLGPAGGLAVVMLLALAGLGTSQGWISVGGAVVFLFAARSAFSDIESLVADLGDLRAARTSLARVLDLIEAAAPDPVGRAVTPQPGGALTVEQVDFHYGDPSRPALTDVSMAVRCGERVALAGPTGAGKSTLAKLLAGLYRPASGRVAYGGVSLTDVEPAELRRHIVLVPQEVVLVPGTVADNLVMVPGLSLDESGLARISAMARRLGLAEWVAGLPDGLDTDVGDEGGRLSAGERQLIALLRAALTPAGVLVLDEATADVDPGTAARVEDALTRLTDDRAVVVVAHRPDTIARADRVIHVVAGRIGCG